MRRLNPIFLASQDPNVDCCEGVHAGLLSVSAPCGAIKEDLLAGRQRSVQLHSLNLWT